MAATQERSVASVSRIAATYSSPRSSPTDIGTSKLYGQYQDYQSFGLDVGFRRYANGLDAKLRPYAEGTVGLGFVDETDIVLVAPTANLAGNATDFDDRTTALTLGANAGLLWQLADRFGVFGQLGVRWVSGMSEVDGLQGTGLETINDKSALDAAVPRGRAR